VIILNVRRLVAAVVAMACIVGISGAARQPAYAQQPPAGGAARPNPFKELNLTPDQEKKIGAIGQKYATQAMDIQKKMITKYGPQAETIQKSTVPTPEKQKKLGALQKKAIVEAMPQVKAVVVKMHAEMESILKPDQKAKFAKIKATQMAAIDKQMKAAGAK
jgi:Spy/CpxP family protein refolding chaperone